MKGEPRREASESLTQSVLRHGDVLLPLIVFPLLRTTSWPLLERLNGARVVQETVECLLKFRSTHSHSIREQTPTIVSN